MVDELHPIKASKFLRLPEPVRDGLVASGVVAVNDALFTIWAAVYSILLLFGGRGGGKSEAACDKLLEECLTETYFKCYYGRKVYDTVRGSCFATLVYCIKKNKLSHLFSFSEAEHSSMIITCKKNGNKFIPFGSDKADKLKSIKDPTHIWCEEFDQFDFADFKELYPTLRTIRGANKFLATFNTHGVYPQHWILKVFFPDIYEGEDRADVQNVNILEGKKVEKLFVNYTDNYFIDQHAYRQTLWISAGGNLSIFEGMANGAWGINLNDSPYAYAFDRNKHVSNPQRGVPHPVLNRNYSVILSFDFNRNPMSCLVSQMIEGHLYFLEAIKKQNAGVEAICDHIKLYYPGCLYEVTGDYNGNSEQSLFNESITHYKLIKQYLNLSEGQLRVRPNPKQAKNSTHVNNVLAWFPITINAVKAAALVFDLENAKRRSDGTILKQDRDKPEQQLDLLDCFVGETMVITSGGEKRIDSLQLGEKVLTRNGYRKITDKWSSIAEVWEFEFSNGTKIICTKEHRFYTSDGYLLDIFYIFKINEKVCQLKEEQYSKPLQSTKELSIMVGAIINIQSRNISTLQTKKTTANACIGKCGLMLLALFQLVMTFTIKTKTRLITLWRTLSLRKSQNMPNIIWQKEWQKTLSSLLTCKKRALQLLPSGTDQKKGWIGIDKTQSITDLDTKLMASKPANIAAKSSLQKQHLSGSVQTTASQHGDESITQTERWLPARNAEKSLKQKNINQQDFVQSPASLLQTHMEVWVKRVTYKGRQVVYDITVDEDHEFYANGILVHNCMRYTVNEFLDGFDPITYAAQNNLTISLPPSTSNRLNYSSDPASLAIAAMDKGQTVSCTVEEYKMTVRNAILKQAGVWVDESQTVKAQIALMEVKRLDELFK